MTTIYYKKISHSVKTPLNKEEVIPVMLGSTVNFVYSELQNKDSVTIANEISKQCDLLMQNLENDYVIISTSDKK